MSDFKFRRLGPKLVVRTGYYGTAEDPHPTHAHWCPACNRAHDIAVEKPFRNGARWTFDGDLQAPSFTPSINISWGPNSRGQTYRCHYFIKRGRIQYCADSTHALCGQTVDLPDLPPEATQWADEQP